MGIGILSGGQSGVALSVLTSLHIDFSILSYDMIYRMSRLRGCYTGLGPTRAFPPIAVVIVTWEVAMKLLGIKNN
ncbi:hypothetical protein J1N35_013459 [Gossypium stocksii]|uniref:Uncharacterized protein n=1 Tax=Gossypium stocksii TaxID=47602 RepID=A0A9D3VTT8_9ROSI|nr:hypothetical protein J1N35_013459 [Gossypium stocksii]